MIHWNGNKRKLLLIQIPWNYSQAYIIHRLLGMAPRVEFLDTSSRDVKIFSFFLREPIFLLCSSLNAHTYACMHARTHARARAHTHTHTNERSNFRFYLDVPNVVDIVSLRGSPLLRENARHWKPRCVSSYG